MHENYAVEPKAKRSELKAKRSEPKAKRTTIYRLSFSWLNSECFQEQKIFILPVIPTVTKELRRDFIWQEFQLFYLNHGFWHQAGPGRLSGKSESIRYILKVNY